MHTRHRGPAGALEPVKPELDPREPLVLGEPSAVKPAHDCDCRPHQQGYERQVKGVAPSPEDLREHEASLPPLLQSAQVSVQLARLALGSPARLWGSDRAGLAVGVGVGVLVVVALVWLAWG